MQGRSTRIWADPWISASFTTLSSSTPRLPRGLVSESHRSRTACVISDAALRGIREIVCSIVVKLYDSSIFLPELKRIFAADQVHECRIYALMADNCSR